jgi:hypothetical protein
MINSAYGIGGHRLARGCVERRLAAMADNRPLRPEDGILPRAKEATDITGMITGRVAIIVKIVGKAGG